MREIHEVVKKIIKIKLPQADMQSNRHKPILYIVVMLICIFTTSMLTTSLVSSYSAKRETEKQIMEMQNFLEDWKQKITSSISQPCVLLK